MLEFNIEDVQKEFPINSQTSVTDKIALLQVRQIMQRSLPSYAYLEIGSFLGGSLTPFLNDPRCERILSVDERNRQQSDERGVKYDYVGITHQTMIDNLLQQGFDLGKLTTFDGSIDAYRDAGLRFDLAFIDGEHTDFACFRDFIHARKLLKPDAVIAFHDSTLVYKSLRIIQEFLLASGERFKFVKVGNAEISCIFQNAFASLQPEEFFAVDLDLNAFYVNAEKVLLSSIVQNRLSINLSWKDTPVTRAY